MKPAMKSRTIWLNWMGRVLIVGAAVQLYLPELGFGPVYTAWGMLGLSLAMTFGNNWLRRRTDTGIG